MSLSQYLEICSKSFCSILYIYYRVSCTLVSQISMYGAFSGGVNLFNHQFGSSTPNTQRCAVEPFYLSSIHMGLSALTFLMVGTFAMADSIFSIVI